MASVGFAPGKQSLLLFYYLLLSRDFMDGDLLSECYNKMGAIKSLIFNISAFSYKSGSDDFQTVSMSDLELKWLLIFH